MKKGSIFLFSFFLILSLTGTNSEALILSPPDGIDTIVTSHQPSTNYGATYPFLESFGSPIPDRGIHGLLRFDLPSELIGISAKSAYLHLYLSNMSFSPSEVNFSRATSSWDELTVTWDTRPSFDDTFQTTKSLIASDVNTWLEIDITDMLNFWLSNPTQNFGMVLNANTDRTGVLFRSSDFAGTNYDPRLTINPVPEPSTFLLLGSGLASLAFYARRRRKE